MYQALTLHYLIYFGGVDYISLILTIGKGNLWNVFLSLYSMCAVTMCVHGSMCAVTKYVHGSMCAVTMCGHGSMCACICVGMRACVCACL